MSIHPNTGVITWTPDSNDTVQVTVQVSDGVLSALQTFTITPGLFVNFEELGSNYGYDDFTNPNLPWKSVAIGFSDTVRATITPANAFTSMQFVSSQPSRVTVTPASATSGIQTLTLQGVSRGESNVEARLNQEVMGTLRTKAYNVIHKTVAVTLIHERASGAGDSGYSSTDISDSAIISELKTVYKQAVIEWTVVRKAAKTIEFDLNNDGFLDTTDWMTAEMSAIVAQAETPEEFNIFLVDRDIDGALGIMDFNQKFGFVNAGAGNGANTLAHELGHGNGLFHTHDDELNVMHPTNLSVTKLRKDQWDSLNP